MKIDLNELERKARAAPNSLWCMLGPPEPSVYFDGDNNIAQEDAFIASVATSIGDTNSEVDEAIARHIAANSPPVTLALISRIRELEELAGDLLSEHVRWPERDRAPGSEQYALLEKGAVLP